MIIVVNLSPTFLWWKFQDCTFLSCHAIHYSKQWPLKYLFIEQGSDTALIHKTNSPIQMFVMLVLTFEIELYATVLKTSSWAIKFSALPIFLLSLILIVIHILYDKLIILQTTLISIHTLDKWSFKTPLHWWFVALAQEEHLWLWMILKWKCHTK